MELENNIVFIAIAAVLIGGVIGYFVYPAMPLDNNNLQVSNQTACGEGEPFSLDMSKVDEMKSLMKDIYFIQTGQEHDVEYKEYKEDSGLLILSLIVDGSYPQDVYVTKDFKYILQQPTELKTLKQQVKDAKEQVEQQLKPVEVPKTDKPTVELFVMSYCPYGLQAEKAMLPVINLLGDKADISIKFVNYAMHGDKEMQENIRQYCIQEEQGDKYLDYLTCFVDSGNYEECLNESNVDAEALDACMDRVDSQYNLTKNYPSFPIYDEENVKYGVRGSPTLVINGVKVENIARSPQAFKEAVCNAFTTQPSECSASLSADSMPPSFGYSGAGGNSGSCG